MCMNELEHSPQDPPEPETGDEKEIYAFYGLARLASYNAQVAERGLMQLALLLRLQRIPNVTRATYDQEYEALARRSFGQIPTELAGDQTLANDLRALLQKTLGLRNHLTHHFFWDFAEELVLSGGAPSDDSEAARSDNSLLRSGRQGRACG